ncbi:Hypothetical protein HVR_LOCUS485 [uncultured virus]|nr:Hypothetical protein HVR_LOCUS485 [uncultured virus]
MILHVAHTIHVTIFVEKKERHAEINKKRAVIFITMIILFIIVIILGTLGYVYIFGSTWIDAFYNVILTAISVEVEPQTMVRNYL